MDATRFDSLIRSLSIVGSRRRALGLVLSGTITSLLAHEEIEAHDALIKCKKLKGERKKKCVKKAKKHNAQDAANLAPPPPLPPCGNGIKDGNETDIDCGGGTCPRCTGAKACASRNDCENNLCVNRMCTTSRPSSKR